MIRSKFAFVLTFAAVAAIFCIASAPAANILLSIDYAGSFAPDGVTPLPGSPPAPLFSQNAPHSGAPAAAPNVPGAYHQFDVFMTITGAAAGEDFQSLIFDLDFGPGVTPSDFGYIGADPTIDPAGPTPLGSIFSQNGDAGSSTTDMKAITVIASNTGNHARTHAAQPGEAGGTLPVPTLLGSAYVFWDGSFENPNPGAKSWLSVIQPANVLNPWSTVILNAGTAQPASTMAVGPREEWVQGGVVPSFNVLNLNLESGRLPGALITAGPLPTDDLDTPDSGIAWSLVSLIGPDGAEVGATVDPLTGVFNWQTSLTEGKGDYTATIQGVNAGPNAGTDTGLLTFHIVPEPATFSLLGLAMVGALGFIRRR